MKDLPDNILPSTPLQSHFDVPVVADLKQIYTAVNEEQASIALLEFAEKWDNKYPMISASWTRHWQEIIPFL